MNSEFTEEAKQDLEKLDKSQLKAIKSKVEELEDDPAGENSKLIQVAGREIYRSKVKEQRGESIDHRIVYDIRNGKIVIYSVFHRDTGYDKDELDRRLK